ncbi:Abi family protein [Xylanimonas protaetiae]|uniref:Abi family protein n=1 Tax=Xylanimonas protaetiae TaxID=2509457 RepID=UPI0013EB2D9A|nr:Abi family protein [Xylanimonas protaetiae]
MDYTKPHKNYAEQVQLLTDRGLEVSDRAVAVRALKRLGYYRLSAYTYPLRRPSEDGQGRAPEFVDGARLDDALTLCDFDDRLRATLLSGLQKLEVAMRAQVGYQLGKTHPFGHLDPKHLDTARCQKPPARRGPNDERDAHATWLDRYEQLRSESKNEDYVRHFILTYDGQIPVWVATEFMTFGCLTALYDLVSDRDAAAIARNVAVKNRDVVYGWLKALNVLRNHCAHNARIWNRKTIYPPKRPGTAFLPERLAHLSTADNNRVYFLAAICAHFLIELDPSTGWPRQFRETMRKFRPVHGMTAENTMGFPADWESLDIWRYQPE